MRTQMNGFLILMSALLMTGCGMDGSFSTGGGGWLGPTAPVENPAEGDKYEAVGSNPFVITASDAVSTFAVDVDTASYDIFRRDITELNQLPHPDSVRLEEFVNAFTYNYPKPIWGGEHPFTIQIESATHAFSSKEKNGLVRIGIQGVEVPDEEKKPANLVFLVDVSGSMSSPNKLELVKKLITETLTVLDPSDHISIVTYAGHETVALEPTPVSEIEDILDAIDDLDASGSTAGQAGMQLAYSQAEAGFIEGGVNHVIMCTDGDFNVGMSSTDDLVDFITEKRETGITLTALGFGYGNLNDAMMEAVSNAGNGFYSVISNADHVVEYAQKKLLNTVFLIARDVKIQVEFNPQHVYAYRLLGYENRAIADHDFTNDKVDAGEVGSGHQVTALYEIVWADPRNRDQATATMAPASDRPLDPVASIDGLCQVRLRYKHVDAEPEAPAIQFNQDYTETDRNTPLSQASESMQWAAAVAAFAEILKESPYGSKDNLGAIQSVIEANAEGGEGRMEFNGLLNKAIQLLQTDTGLTIL